MIMTENQIFRCQNRSCGCEIRVIKSAIEGNSNPRCCCGGEMKKPYMAPVLREVSSKILVGQRAENN